MNFCEMKTFNYFLTFGLIFMQLVSYGQNKLINIYFDQYSSKIKFSVDEIKSFLGEKNISSKISTTENFDTLPWIVKSNSYLVVVRSCARPNVGDIFITSLNAAYSKIACSLSK